MSLTFSRLFSILRLAIGLYCVFFFLEVSLTPASFFCDQRLDFLRPSLSPFFWLNGRPDLFRALCLTGLAAGLLVAADILRRSASFALWILLVLVLMRNPSLYEVHLPYLGLSLWLLAFLPKEHPDRTLFSIEIQRALLFVMGVSYSFSGISKLVSPSWDSGEMLKSFFELGFGFSFFQSWFEGISTSALAVASVFVAATEALALPLLLLPQTRKWIWILLTCGQLQLLVSSRLNHISIMMLIFHCLLFGILWPRQQPQGQNTQQVSAS